MIPGSFYPSVLTPYSPETWLQLTDVTQSISLYDGVSNYFIGYCSPPTFMDYSIGEIETTANYTRVSMHPNRSGNENVSFGWGSYYSTSVVPFATAATAQADDGTNIAGTDFRLFNNLDCGKVFSRAPVVMSLIAFTTYNSNNVPIDSDVVYLPNMGGGLDTAAVLAELEDSTNRTYSGHNFTHNWNYAEMADGPHYFEETDGNGNTVKGWTFLWAVWCQGGRDLTTAYDYTTESRNYTNPAPFIKAGDYLIEGDFEPWNMPLTVVWDNVNSPAFGGGILLTGYQDPEIHYVGGVEFSVYDQDPIRTTLHLTELNGNCILRNTHGGGGWGYRFNVYPYITLGDIKKYISMFPNMAGLGSPKFTEDYGVIEDEFSDDPDELAPWQSDITENAFDGEAPPPEPEPMPDSTIVLDGDLIIPDNNTDAHGTEPGSDFRTTNLRSMNQFITMDSSAFDALKVKLAQAAVAPDVNSFWSKLGPQMFKSDGQGGYILDEVTTATSNSIGDYIVSARVYPFTMNGVCPLDNTPKTDIAFGYQGAVLSGVAHYDITKPYGVIDCGSVSVRTFAQYSGWGNAGDAITFLDEQPYTKVRIVLPAIGSFELNPQMVVGHTIYVKYGIDLTNGICTAIVTSAKTGQGSDGGTRLLVCKSGKIAYDLTMSGNNLTAQTDNIAVSTLQKQAQSINTARMQMGIAKDVMTTATQLMSAGTKQNYNVATLGHLGEKAVETMLNIATTNVAEMKVNIDGIIASRDVPQTITHGSSDAGFAGQVEPYIIVQRPRVDNLYNTEHFRKTYGRMVNKVMKLKTGYNEVVNPRVNIEGATQAELAQINSLLRSGVYVNG